MNDIPYVEKHNLAFWRGGAGPAPRCGYWTGQIHKKWVDEIIFLRQLIYMVGFSHSHVSFLQRVYTNICICMFFFRISHGIQSPQYVWSLFSATNSPMIDLENKKRYIMRIQGLTLKVKTHSESL